MHRRSILTAALLAALLSFPVVAKEGEGTGALAFEQLGHLLPTPGETRTASGAPGPGYWQQRADYVIRVELDDDHQTLTGSEEIVYRNLSPHTLSYLWIQLDQNRFRTDSDDMLAARAPDFDEFSYRALATLLARRQFDGGFQITRVAGAGGDELEHTIVKTMMRVDLPEPLVSGESFTLNIDWRHNILDAVTIRARGAAGERRVVHAQHRLAP